MKRYAILIALLAVPVFALATQAGAASRSGAHAQRVSHASSQRLVIYNLEPVAEYKPQRYFFFADASPYVQIKRWVGWGTSTAIGYGTFVSECGDCMPLGRTPAKLVLTDPEACRKRGGRVYGRGRLEREPGSRDALFTPEKIDPTGGFC
jgi:hypothetical protein